MTKTAKPPRTHRKRPDAASRALKAKAEADAQTAFWDRLERVGAKLIDALTAPGVIPAVAGGALGGIAMYPQTITATMDLDDVEIFGTGTPPAQKQACEDAAKVKHDADTASINAQYEACVAGCGGPPDRRQNCQDACEQERARKQRIADAAYFRAVDQCGQFFINGERHHFHFTALITAYFHTLIPNIGIGGTGAIDLPWPLPDVPATEGWNLRDAFRFSVKKVISVDVAADDSGVVHYESVQEAQKKAEKLLTAALKRDFLLLGITAGASGALIASFLSGTGEILKGIGEIVPL